MKVRFFCSYAPLIVVVGIALVGCDGTAVITSEPAPVVSQPIVTEPIVTQPIAPVPIVTQPIPEVVPAVTPPTPPEPPSQPVVTPASDTAETPAPVQSPQVEAPPTAAPQFPTPADITDLILITGQSNALGAGTDYDASIDGSNARVFAFTDKGWQKAELNQIWDLNWFPQNDPLTDPSNNFSLHFGRKVADRDSSRVIGFVLATAPGMAIRHWRRDGEFFNEIRNKVSNAINQLPSKAAVDGVLWHQGESDGADDDAYGDALYELISNFRSESWFGEGKPFICGETAMLAVNQQLRKLNSDNDPWTGCVGGEGLPTHRDGSHFSGEGLRIIGRQYGDKYLEMVR